MMRSYGSAFYAFDIFVVILTFFIKETEALVGAKDGRIRSGSKRGTDCLVK